MDRLSQQQTYILVLAYSYERDHDGAPAPIATELTNAYFSHDAYNRAFGTYGETAYKRAVLFMTRRAVRALIDRGLMTEAATTAVSHSRAGYPDEAVPGRRLRKGYTRTCKTYRLTDAGRVIGKAEFEMMRAEPISPETAELIERAKAAARAVTALATPP